MKYTVKAFRFPEGIYQCQIDSVTESRTQKGDSIIVVKYKITSGERFMMTFIERMNSVSEKFVKALGLDQKLGDSGDTNAWIGKSLVVEVKYSDDDKQWPRFGHFPSGGATLGAPEFKKAVDPQAPADDSEIPF